ncbi:hypothetical protein BV20DRAFT_984098 [Pilatotrama ljubarskyi]|nr:hypothetical protein BV20DRAFT_984098 [Pilatotrama ljubarskyi]
MDNTPKIEYKSEYFFAIFDLGAKMTDEVMSPIVGRPIRAASHTLTNRMVAAIPDFVPDRTGANPATEGFTLEDLTQCVMRSGNDQEEAVKLAFKMPQAQLALDSWKQYAREYVDAVHTSMETALLCSFENHIPPVESLRRSVKMQIIEYLKMLRDKTWPIVAQFVDYNRRPFTMATDELAQLTCMYEKRYLSELANASETAIDDLAAAALRVMAEVRAYFEIMRKRANDMVVGLTWSELWDSFVEGFRPSLLDNTFM